MNERHEPGNEVGLFVVGGELHVLVGIFVDKLTEFLVTGETPRQTAPSAQNILGLQGRLVNELIEKVVAGASAVTAGLLLGLVVALLLLETVIFLVFFHHHGCCWCRRWLLPNCE